MSEASLLARPAPAPQPITSLPAATAPAWRVTEAGDAVERSADAMAARALGEPTRPGLQSRPAPAVTETVTQAAALRGGEALPPGLAEHFGTRFGQDLSDVRLHRGPAAAAATQALGTPAFAIGRSIHMAPSAWRPETPGGQRLLAHELAHTVQNLLGTIARFAGDAAALEGPRAGSDLAEGPARHDPRAAAAARRRAGPVARRREAGHAASTGAPPPQPDIVPPPPGRPRPTAPRTPSVELRQPPSPGPAAIAAPAAPSHGTPGPLPSAAGAVEAGAEEAASVLQGAEVQPADQAQPAEVAAAPPAAAGGLPPLAGMVSGGEPESETEEGEESPEAEEGQPADLGALFGSLIMAGAAANERIASAAEAARKAISTKRRQSEGGLRAAKTRQVNAINAAYGTQRALLAGMVLAAHGQINAARLGRRAEAALRGANGMLEMAGVFATHRQAILGLVTAASTRAERIRTTAATRLTTRANAQEATARRMAMDAWGRYGTSERAAHMASAANETATTTADEIASKRAEAVTALDESTADLPDAIEDARVQSLQGLDDGLPGLQTQVQENTTATLADLDRRAAEAHRLLAGSAALVDAELAMAAAQAVAAAEAGLPEQIRPLQSAADAGRRGIADAEAAAQEALAQRQAEADALLAETESPEAESAGEFTDGVAELLSGMGEDAAAEFANLSTAVTDQMDRAVGAGAASYQLMARAAIASATARVGGMAGQLSEFIGSVDAGFASGLTAQDQTIREGCTSVAADLQPNATEVRQHLDTMLNDAQRDVNAQVTEALGKNDEALGELPGKMSEAASDAGWDYDHPVLSTLRDIGLVVAGVIAGILLVLAVVVLVIVLCKVLIIGLVALGVSAVVAKVIVVCAAIAVAGYFAGQAIAAHLAAGESVASSIGNAALDMIGVNQMRAAFSGKGTLFERGFAFGQGFATLVTTVVPFARLARVRVNARFGTRIPALRAPRPLRVARVRFARSSAGRPITRALANPVATGQRINAAAAQRVRAVLGLRPAGGAVAPPAPTLTPPPAAAPPALAAPPRVAPPAAPPARVPTRPAAAVPEPTLAEPPAGARRTALPEIPSGRSGEAPARAAPETPASRRPTEPAGPEGPATATPETAPPPAEPPRLRSIRGGGEGSGRPRGRLAEVGREPPPPEPLPPEAAAQAVPEPMRMAAGAEGGVVEGGAQRLRPEVIQGGAEAPGAMASTPGGGGTGGSGGRGGRAPGSPAAEPARGTSSGGGRGGASRGGSGRGGRSRPRATPEEAGTAERAAAEGTPEAAAAETPAAETAAAEAAPEAAPASPPARPRGRTGGRAVGRPSRPRQPAAEGGRRPGSSRRRSGDASGEGPARGQPRPNRQPTPPPERPPGPAAPTDPLSVRIEGMESARLGNMMEAIFTAAETRFYGMRYRSNPALRARIDALAAEARATGQVNANSLAPVDRITLYRQIAHEGVVTQPRTTVVVERPVGMGTEGTPSRSVEVVTHFADDPARPYQVRGGVVARGRGRGRTYRAMQSDMNRTGQGGRPSGPATYLRRSPAGGPDRLAHGAEAAETRVVEASRAGGGAVDQALESSLVDLGAENMNTWQAMRRPANAQVPPPAGPALPEPAGVTLPERIGGTGDINSMAGKGSSRVAQFDARRPGVTDVGRNTAESVAANRARRFYGRAEGVRTLNRVAAEELASGSQAGQRLAPVRNSFREFVRSFLDVTQPEAGTTTTASEAAESFASAREEFINALVEMMQRQSR